MELVGLDFETANPNSGSICAVGAALLENGKLTKTCEWLVRPHASVDWMLPKFTEIHGIEYLELRESPEFPEIWDSLKDVLQAGKCIIAHNARFDLRHLKRALQLYSLPAITFSYACSLEISRTCIILWTRWRSISISPSNIMMRWTMRLPVRELRKISDCRENSSGNLIFHPMRSRLFYEY